MTNVIFEKTSFIVNTLSNSEKEKAENTFISSMRIGVT